jgi:hypothetical protein
VEREEGRSEEGERGGEKQEECNGIEEGGEKKESERRWQKGDVDVA